MIKITAESFRSNKALVRFAKRCGHTLELTQDQKFWRVTPEWAWCLPDGHNAIALIPLAGNVTVRVCRLNAWGSASRYQAAAFLLGMSAPSM